MLHLFNKVELCITYDLKKCAEIRNILQANHIEYSLNTINLRSSGLGNSRGRTGTLGENINLQYEYKFYVHKKEYEKAKYLIQK